MTSANWTSRYKIERYKYLQLKMTDHFNIKHTT